MRGLLCCFWLLPTVAFAGHGLVSAFSDPSALPEPTAMPDQLAYALEQAREDLRLITTADPSARYALGHELAHEKIAEMFAMVEMEKAGSAALSIRAYERFLNIAFSALGEMAEDFQAATAEHFFNTLLEHQYVISIYYIDFPIAARQNLRKAIEIAENSKARLLPRLSATFRESLFFKEDQVRWSLEMSERADEQGLGP
ncbi:MAG: DUF5667 domain-containing protein [Pseudomonadota bacterium]